MTAVHSCLASPNSHFFPSFLQKSCSPLFSFLTLEEFILLSSVSFLKSFRFCSGGKENWRLEGEDNNGTVVPSWSGESKLKGAKQFDIWVKMLTSFDPSRSQFNTAAALDSRDFFPPPLRSLYGQLLLLLLWFPKSICQL